MARRIIIITITAESTLTRRTRRIIWLLFAALILALSCGAAAVWHAAYFPRSNDHQVELDAYPQRGAK